MRFVLAVGIRRFIGSSEVGGGEGTEGKEKTGGDDTQEPRDDEGE